MVRDYLIHVGQGVLALASTRTFHEGRCGLACSLAQRSSNSAGLAAPAKLGGGAGATCSGYWRPPEAKAATNCVSRAVAPAAVPMEVRCRAPKNTTSAAAIATMNPGQNSWRSGARASGWTGGCGTRRNFITLPKWRRWMGIEPTWGLFEPHAGFEDHDRHQPCKHLHINYLHRS